jgi:hypothetical protein
MAGAATALIRWATRLFGGEIAERVFVPLVADWQHDLAGRSTLRTRAVAHVRWAAAGVRAAILVGIDLAAPRRWPAGAPGPVRRALLVCALSSTAGVLMSQVLRLHVLAWRELTAGLVLALLANVVTIASPLALAQGAVWLGRVPRGDRHAVRWMLGGVTIAVLAVQLALVGWILPFVVRLERDVRNERVPAHVTLRETPAALALPELVRHGQERAPLELYSYARRNELWDRITWVVWPAAAAVFGWRLGRRTSGRGPALVGGVPFLLPLAALLAPLLLTPWLVVGGYLGAPSTPVRFLPTLLLLATAALLRQPVGSAGEADAPVAAKEA